MNTFSHTSNNTEVFRAARDRLMRGGAAPCSPRLAWFNWALDWFDQVPDPGRRAAIVIGQEGVRGASYADLSQASHRIANLFLERGAVFGDRVLVMMRNSVEYYAIALACMKLGMPLIPVFPSLPRVELEDRIRRSRVRHLVADAAALPALSWANPGGLRIVVGAPVADWSPLSDADGCPDRFNPVRQTRPDDPMLGYFTSGTTSQPKLVMHSHQSYTFGHLSSLYWQGIGPGDVHANVSAPGWAKHSWSSLFVPFSAAATTLVFTSDRPDPGVCLDALRCHDVTSFCAPPSYWRALERGGLGEKPPALRQIVSAGESLDESVSGAVLQAWGLAIRDGYGQTEATAMIGFAPGRKLVRGGLGYALPGYPLVLVDPVTGEPGVEGEICLDLRDSPVGLMLGYVDDSGMPALPPGRYYRTGDLARRDENGCFHLFGRADDVFKSYDVRVSPVEVERALRRHPLIADVGVFAVADRFGESVPAAACVAANPADVGSLPDILLRWQRDHLSESHCVVRVWMVDQLPRTLSGKANRAALRSRFAGLASQPILDPVKGHQP